MADESLYEQYKNALRQGHVAAVRGRPDAALAAYAQAAALVPDRPLPHTSRGRVLIQLGRPDEALVAFAQALRRAPRDEAALSGRADALIAAGRAAEAAGVLDLLADTQEAAGRLSEACDTARRALELAESKARRRHLEALAAELRDLVPEGSGDALERALRTLEAPDERIDRPGPSAVEPPPDPGSAAGEPIEPIEPIEPVDVLGLIEAVDSAIESGDASIVHEAVLEAATEFRRAGLLDAAIDACQLGLTVAPADPDLHLALAELDLAHGWPEVAADKLAMLARFVDLTHDQAAHERLCALIWASFADDPRLVAICS